MGEVRLAAAAFAALLVASSAGARAASEDQLILNYGFEPRNVGYVVSSLETGAVVRSVQADRLFIPASTVKLATAYAALETLGPAYRFRTPVYATQTPGGLALRLEGGGDPLLVQENLQALAADLAGKVGGRAVASFTFSQSALPFVSAIDPGDDLANSYNPPVSALSVNFNRQWLRWERQPDHFALIAGIVPNLGHAEAGVSAARAFDGRPVQVLTPPLRPLAPTRFLLEPQVPSAGQRRVAVRQPALRTALMLRQYARQAGLDLPWPTEITEAAAPLPAAGQPIAAAVSEPLPEIASALLKDSNNLSAELVGLTVSKQLGYQPQALSESARAVRRWLEPRVPAMAAPGTHWTNLSGLSGSARLSPAALLDLMQKAKDSRYGDRSFLGLLSEPRWSTRGPNLSIRAKSGTMSYSRGQSGVLATPDGRRFLFVLMHTDFDARRRFETDPQRFSEEVRRQAGQWMAQARRLERAMLRYWSENL